MCKVALTYRILVHSHEFFANTELTCAKSDLSGRAGKL